MMRLVSVPYWGSLYFNEKFENNVDLVAKFPSPIGVLYISMQIEEDLEKAKIMFPSPIGVLYISIMIKKIMNELFEQFPSPIGVLYISING